jgi:hypothetical protein
MLKEHNYSDSNYGYKQLLAFRLKRKNLICPMSKRGHKRPRRAKRGQKA